MSLKTRSLTMEAVCAVRATEAEWLEDGYSCKLLPFMPGARESRELLDRGSRGMFTRSIVLRSMYFNHILKQQAKTHSQLLVLSSGLDLRSLYLDEWKGKRAGCIDHPYSQAYCQEVFKNAGLDVSPIDFMACDFTRDVDRLAALLTTKGFDPRQPTLVLWEGATYYLRQEAVYRLFDVLECYFKEISIYCDMLNLNAYFQGGRPISAGVERNLSFLEQSGEPWVGFFDPKDVESRMWAAGYTRCVTLSRQELELRYLKEVKMEAGSMFFLEAKKERRGE